MFNLGFRIPDSCLMEGETAKSFLLDGIKGLPELYKLWYLPSRGETLVCLQFNSEEDSDLFHYSIGNRLYDTMDYKAGEQAIAFIEATKYSREIIEGL